MARSKWFIGLACILAILGGCVVIDGKSTRYEEKDVPSNEIGPGSEDGVFTEHIAEKWEKDTGKYIAIGILPGVEGPGTKGEFPGFGGRYFVLPCEAVVVNCFTFCIPTGATLLVEPFAEYTERYNNGVRGRGLIGCHRWHDAWCDRGYSRGLGWYTGEYDDSRVRHAKLASELLERRLRRRYEKPTGNFTISFLDIKLDGDKTRVYFEYPGFEVIKRDIGEGDRQPVVAFAQEKDGQYPLRRFMESDYDDDAAAFEDIQVEKDSELGRHIAFYIRRGNVDSRRKELAAFCSEFAAVLDVFAEELKGEKVLGLRAERLDEIEAEVERCELYRTKILPEKKRFETLVARGPGVAEFVRMAAALDFANFPTKESVSVFNIDSVLDKLSILESNISRLDRMTARIQSALAAYPENTELKTMKEKLVLDGPELPTDEEIENFEEALIGIEGKISRINGIKTCLAAIGHQCLSNRVMRASVNMVLDEIAADKSSLPEETRIAELEAFVAKLTADAPVIVEGTKKLLDSGTWRHEDDLMALADRLMPETAADIRTLKARLDKARTQYTQLRNSVVEMKRDPSRDEGCKLVYMRNNEIAGDVAAVMRRLEEVYVLWKKTEVFSSNDRLLEELETAKENCRNVTNEALERKSYDAPEDIEETKEAWEGKFYTR